MVRDVNMQRSSKGSIQWYGNTEKSRSCGLDTFRGLGMVQCLEENEY